MKIWTDITRNAEGRYVALDVFKAVAFVLGCVELAFACFGNVIAFTMQSDKRIYQPVEIPSEPGLIMLFLAFGLQNSKIVQAYFDRKTLDGNGHALATKTSTEASPPQSPELMPQAPTQPTDSTTTTAEADMPTS